MAFLTSLENLVALGGAGGERKDVVVVELEAVAIALGETLNAVDGRQFRPGLVAERVAAPILEAPDAEGELILLGRGEVVGRHGSGTLGKMHNKVAALWI